MLLTLILNVVSRVDFNENSAVDIQRGRVMQCKQASFEMTDFGDILDGPYHSDFPLVFSKWKC